MILPAKNKRQVIIRKLVTEDFEKLYCYLQHLSPGTLKRFGPHGFDYMSILDFYENPDISAYIAQDFETMEIIAYSVIKTGYLEHDSPRLLSYGLLLVNRTDCTFAPSVADPWQGQGIGYSLFRFMLSDLKTIGMKRIILWGGVQSDNLNAIDFYTRNGFKTLGQFEYNGQNLDMALDIFPECTTYL